jgi:SAM-dependent methyltransferase
MFDASVTVNPYININGAMTNDRFFPVKAEDEYNKSGLFNANQIMEGYRKRVSGPIDTIADMGCGNLRIGRFLAKEFNHFIGVDISKNVLESAKAKAIEYNIKNASFVLSSEFDEENICDLIICFQVIQHNPYNAQIEIIQKIKKALKPGGWACIHLPKHENKPDYVNYNTCMCFTTPQALELGSYFSKCELEERLLSEGWLDHYMWVQKEEK